MTREINPGQARSKHGIWTRHSREVNGEVRFRLMKDDGTGYIRTETEQGAWQQSHFHRAVRETYLVQSGWMAFAELRDGRLGLAVVERGGTMTSRPGVIHNVYLPAGGVIHTVKHGGGSSLDRETSAETRAFDEITRRLASEEAIRATAIKTNSSLSYSEEYRHFDMLIWQVRAWATAIFALSVQAALEVADGVEMSSLAGRNAKILSLLLGFLAVAIGCFSFVLARFRIHQNALKGYRRTPSWHSASAVTQTLVTAESLILASIAAVILEAPLLWTVCIATGLTILVVPWSERVVRVARI